MDFKPYPFLTREMLDFSQSSVFTLEVDAWTNSASQIILTGYTKSGYFRAAINTFAAMAGRTTIVGITDIPLSLTLFITNGEVQIDQTFAKITLTINGDRVATLASGYVTGQQNLSWPGNQLKGADEGLGLFATTQSGDPAAGSDHLFQAAVNNTFLLPKVFATQLVTDATASNRRVILVITQGNLILKIPAPAVQTASTTVKYIWGVSMPSLNDASGLTQYAPLPDGLILTAAATVETQTTNLQAADNFDVLTVGGQQFLTVTSP